MAHREQLISVSEDASAVPLKVGKTYRRKSDSQIFQFLGMELNSDGTVSGNAIFNEASAGQPSSSPDRPITNTHEALRSDYEQLARAFFGDSYDTLYGSEGIPALPEHAFPDQVFEAIKNKEVMPIYSPGIDFANIPNIPTLTKDTDLDQYISKLQTVFPNWFIPQKWLFERVKKHLTTNGSEGIAPKYLTIPKGWHWIETSKKPKYDVNNLKPYEGASSLMALLATELQKSINPREQEIGALLIVNKRHSISQKEINTIIMPKIADILNDQSISLPYPMLWSLFANMQAFQENSNQKPANAKQGQGKTNSWAIVDGENKTDRGGVLCLIAGNSGFGGLEFFDSDNADEPFLNSGFCFSGSAS